MGRHNDLMRTKHISQGRFAKGENIVRPSIENTAVHNDLGNVDEPNTLAFPSIYRGPHSSPPHHLRNMKPLLVIAIATIPISIPIDQGTMLKVGTVENNNTTVGEPRNGD